MVRPLFDTNILIDYLRGATEARSELRRYPDKAISIISWMEVMIGAGPDVRDATRAFLGSFTVVSIDAQVAERAVSVRQTYRLKLPDAIIWASAQVHDMLLVTRDTKGFPANDPGVRVPYTLPG